MNEGRKSLMFNGAEYFRIENGKYYTTDKDDECIIEVSKEVFKAELEKCNWIMNSWDKKLRQQYIEMKNIVEG